MRVADLNTGEYAQFYATYISKVGDKTLLKALEANSSAAVDFYQSIPADKHEYRYAEGKWTIKEVLQHILDTERVFAYRALRIARRDATPLPGFEQNGFNEAADANKRSLDNLIEEYKVLRASTKFLFANMTDEDLKTIGTASDNSVSARALGFMILGHEAHHIGIIKERYL